MVGAESDASEFQSAEHVVRLNETHVESDGSGFQSDGSQVESDELQVGLKESEGGLDTSELRLNETRVRLAVAQVGLKMVLVRLKLSGGGPRMWKVESDELGIQSAERQFQSRG